MRNSLLVAPMPTASTSQILGNNECFEAFTSNLYVRRTLSGEFIVLNKTLGQRPHRCRTLEHGIEGRNPTTQGIIQAIEGIPDNIKALYKTTWEIKQKHVLDMAADRGAYIDQSQSMNIHMIDANAARSAQCTSMVGSPVLRQVCTTYEPRLLLMRFNSTVESKAKNDPTVNGLAERAELTSMEEIACSLDSPDDCLSLWCLSFDSCESEPVRLV